VCEQLPAALVHPERFRTVAGCGMGLHQAPVAGFEERLEGDRLLGPLGGVAWITRAEARVGEDGERADADVHELTPFLSHPCSLVVPG
jgi:hypothetical protein